MSHTVEELRSLPREELISFTVGGPRTPRQAWATTWMTWLARDAAEQTSEMVRLTHLGAKLTVVIAILTAASLSAAIISLL